MKLPTSLSTGASEAGSGRFKNRYHSSLAAQPVERSELRVLLDPVHGVGAVQLVIRLGYAPQPMQHPGVPCGRYLTLGCDRTRRANSSGSIVRH